MGTFARDLRHGVRQLFHNPGFAAAAIGSLALGIGLNVTIFSVVNAVLLRGLALLGWSDHRVVRDGLDFLLRQQSPSGAFGYPAVDDPQQRASMQRRWTQSCVVALATLVALGSGLAADHMP